MEISINKIKTVSKYSFFSLLYIFNLLSLYLFCLVFWRCRDLLNYYDPDYKGHLDIPEMFIGYTGGCVFYLYYHLFIRWFI